MFDFQDRNDCRRRKPSKPSSSQPRGLCPRFFANPTTAWLPLLPLAGARGGGDEGGGALVGAGCVYGFYYARIADPCYGKRGVKRVSEPVLRKRKEDLSNDQPTHCLQAALAIPEGSKPLAGAKRQRHLRWIMSRAATRELGKRRIPKSQSTRRSNRPSSTQTKQAFPKLTARCLSRVLS